MSCSGDKSKVYHQWKYADLDGLDPLRGKKIKNKLFLSLMFCRHMSYEETIVRRQLLFVLVGKQAKLHTSLQSKCKMKGLINSRLLNRFSLFTVQRK